MPCRGRLIPDLLTGPIPWPWRLVKGLLRSSFGPWQRTRCYGVKVEFPKIKVFLNPWIQVTNCSHALEDRMSWPPLCLAMVCIFSWNNCNVKVQSKGHSSGFSQVSVSPFLRLNEEGWLVGRYLDVLGTSEGLRLGMQLPKRYRRLTTRMDDGSDIPKVPHLMDKKAKLGLTFASHGARIQGGERSEIYFEPICLYLSKQVIGTTFQDKTCAIWSCNNFQPTRTSRLSGQWWFPSLSGSVDLFIFLRLSTVTLAKLGW